MILCVILLWLSKIKSSLILMQNMFNAFFFFFLGQFDWKTCFWEIWVEFKCFWNTFHLILIHFIHKTKCALRSFCIKYYVFQKSEFSRFSIDRTYCLIDRKCDKTFDYNLSGSIGARLMLDRLNMFFDRLNLIFDQLKFNLKVF